MLKIKDLLSKVEKRSRRWKLVCFLILVMIATSLSFIISDTPDKVYLNPYYVDIIVLIAGVFLVVDAFTSMKYKSLNFYVLATRGSIGISIVTIHSWQFIFDTIRGLNF